MKNYYLKKIQSSSDACQVAVIVKFNKKGEQYDQIESVLPRTGFIVGLTEFTSNNRNTQESKAALRTDLINLTETKEVDQKTLCNLALNYLCCFQSVSKSLKALPNKSLLFVIEIETDEAIPTIVHTLIIDNKKKDGHLITKKL